MYYKLNVYKICTMVKQDKILGNVESDGNSSRYIPWVDGGRSGNEKNRKEEERVKYFYSTYTYYLSVEYV